MFSTKTVGGCLPLDLGFLSDELVILWELWIVIVIVFFSVVLRREINVGFWNQQIVWLFLLRVVLLLLLLDCVRLRQPVLVFVGAALIEIGGRCGACVVGLLMGLGLRVLL